MKWIEIKMRELGVSTHSGYKLTAFMDNTAMVTVHTAQRGEPTFLVPPVLLLSQCTSFSQQAFAAQNLYLCTCYIVPACSCGTGGLELCLPLYIQQRTGVKAVVLCRRV